MKRAAQPALSVEGQYALDHYAQALQRLEDLSAVTVRNYLSDLRQFIFFPSEKTRGVLTERALGHLITKYARAAHLVDVSPHDLRHRFGYRMAEEVPSHRLAQIMGHDSLDTTMLYFRGTRQDLQRDVEQIAWV